MRHSRVSTTMEIYAQIVPAGQRRAVEQLSEFASRSNSLVCFEGAYGQATLQVIEKIGGASRARTDDLIVANDALSQLSYSPTLRAKAVFASATQFYQSFHRSQLARRVAPAICSETYRCLALCQSAHRTKILVLGAGMDVIGCQRVECKEIRRGERWWCKRARF